MASINLNPNLWEVSANGRIRGIPPNDHHNRILPLEVIGGTVIPPKSAEAMAQRCCLRQVVHHTLQESLAPRSHLLVTVLFSGDVGGVGWGGAIKFTGTSHRLVAYTHFTRLVATIHPEGLLVHDDHDKYDVKDAHYDHRDH